jgi:hypothetical protein
VFLPANSVFDKPNLELTLVSIFLAFSPIATSLLKSAPELHPHYVVVQLQDDPDLVESSADMTGKHSKNSTLIQMDKK